MQCNFAIFRLVSECYNNSQGGKNSLHLKTQGITRRLRSVQTQGLSRVNWRFSYGKLWVYPT